ncbi:MAG: hypothetical protein JRG96_17265 [Deltaproteobacteria bacterium]|nr:hypothetical protein [Deltaproteobacteria bacterium]
MKLRAYRMLSGVLGIAFVVLGASLALAFVTYQEPGRSPTLPTGPVGHYFAALAGCALLAWGGALLGVARSPWAGRSVGTATAVALVAMALIRMLAWVVGDYYVWLGDIPRLEAGFFLVVALAFVWLRPEAPGAGPPPPSVPERGLTS